MPIVIAAVVIAALILIGWAAAVASRRRSAAPTAPKGEVVAPTRPRPEVAEFHVAGDTATVVFAVPIPDAGPDPVLEELLTGEAVEVVREKRHDLPIDQVEVIAVYGRRANGERVLVGNVELASQGSLPPPAVPDLVPHASKVGFDPISNFDSSPVQTPPSLADVPKTRWSLVLRTCCRRTSSRTWTRWRSAGAPSRWWATG